MTEPMEGKPVEQKAPTAAAAGAASKAAATPATQETTSAGSNVTRRRLIWACVWGYLGVNLLMFLRFFFPRALFEPSTIFSVGYPSDFTIGVETKFQQQYRVWVVRNTERLFVVYARCTHLGCTPDWKQSENKFKCPCHGSGYDSEGINFEGPAPRPMDRARVELDATGRIVVDTAKLYVKDPNVGRDEFNDDGAYLVV
jgi:cytochrome b6-f complex iron-sulfur subunit